MLRQHLAPGYHLRKQQFGISPKKYQQGQSSSADAETTA